MAAGLRETRDILSRLVQDGERTAIGAQPTGTLSQEILTEGQEARVERGDALAGQAERGSEEEGRRMGEDGDQTYGHRRPRLDLNTDKAGTGPPREHQREGKVTEERMDIERNRWERTGEYHTNQNV